MDRVGVSKPDDGLVPDLAFLRCASINFAVRIGIDPEKRDRVLGANERSEISGHMNSVIDPIGKVLPYFDEL